MSVQCKEVRFLARGEVLRLSYVVDRCGYARKTQSSCEKATKAIEGSTLTPLSRALTFSIFLYLSLFFLLYLSLALSYPSA